MSAQGKNRITILTPTYNRADRLPLLYESLLAQTQGGFEWLIVDDGSSDNTAEIVSGWIQAGRLPIRFIRRENGGKHCALNTGIREIHTDLCFIVDSDDTLLTNAIQEISSIYARFGLREDLCGYAFYRVDKKGRLLIRKPLRQKEEIGSFAELRIKADNPGDMAEVWFTEVLRRTPFPEFTGERFYSESGVWLRISGALKIVFIAEPIYECEYYADGLTKNRKRTQLNSPRGVLDVSRLLMTRACGFKANLRGGLRYCVFGQILKIPLKQLMRESGRPLLTLICMLPAVPLRSRWTRA